MTQNSRLVLASGSAVRARLLREAGLTFDIVPSSADEDAIKSANRGLALDRLALTLARAKAADVSASRPNDFVIGADQILECAGAAFDKPKDRAQAAAHLRRLRGQTHRLMTACTVYRRGAEVWDHVGAPRLAMRAFDDDFIDAYLKRAGDDVLSSVGAYQLEGLGVHLFESINGDYFSILGLPMLPLLAFLRQEGLLGL